MKTVFDANHPSRIYPRYSKGEQLLKSICPACKSNNVEVIIINEKRLLKRSSTCRECKTVWSMRTAHVPLRYKQDFYSKQ